MNSAGSMGFQKIVPTIGCKNCGARQRKRQMSHLIKLDLTPTEEDVLHIRYRGAELWLPSGVDMDTAASLLRSIQTL